MRSTARSSFRKIFLIVLDGFGEGKDYPFNAIQHSKMPFYRELRDKFPRTQLLTCGTAVGLPEGVMGNSEVGHTNMGAGRIVYQDLTRIQQTIATGTFQKNTAILEHLSSVKAKGGRLHLMGLLSDAGVHSHIDHLYAILEVCAQTSVRPIVHVFTDGRDTPPTSGIQYIKQLQERLIKQGGAIGSIGGRYFAMDRDQRWERVEKGWRAMVEGVETAPPSTRLPEAILATSYQQGVTDEFIRPVCLDPTLTIRDGDGVFFFNFRADRARQITRAFCDDPFAGFSRTHAPKLAGFLGMTQYDKTFRHPVAFGPQNLNCLFPEIISSSGFQQTRIAETEKYAHVTFFFNGGRESPYTGESRILIPSPKDVATYDLKPEMSAFEVAAATTKTIEVGESSFILVNFANPDMVGHTGNYTAAIQALQAIDQCLQSTVTAALRAGYTTLITADHGNIEEMRDNHDQPHTQHTLNPVPLHIIAPNGQKGGANTLSLREGGRLCDLAPTMLDLIQQAQPAEMTGQSLLRKTK